MLNREHELHRRRLGRNAWLGVILGAFVLLIFAVTVVKLSNGGEIRGFDHTFESLGPAR
ncbi:MAG: hypothetical protein KatS3mg118_3590 [Paracoccaceae bacterium]|nr:MAG: hypothetical protein KatS3mg118_3590 [Paracoccaceae bacterium]